MQMAAKPIDQATATKIKIMELLQTGPATVPAVTSALKSDGIKVSGMNIQSLMKVLAGRGWVRNTGTAPTTVGAGVKGNRLIHVKMWRALRGPVTSADVEATMARRKKTGARRGARNRKERDQRTMPPKAKPKVQAAPKPKPQVDLDEPNPLSSLCALIEKLEARVADLKRAANTAAIAIGMPEPYMSAG
jgi:hypothetical protein